MGGARSNDEQQRPHHGRKTNDVQNSVAGAVCEPSRRVLRWLAPVGRMALTNYLTQSVVLLALMARRDLPGVPEMVRRGRSFLVASQEEDGSWPETTRPPGAESYAQRISTTGWATLALLSTPKEH